jgi:prophage regulatory protein
LIKEIHIETRTYIMNERLIRLPQVIAKLGIARSTVWLFVKQGKLPKPIKLSAKVTVWRESELNAYIAEKIGAVQ